MGRQSWQETLAGLEVMSSEIWEGLCWCNNCGGTQGSACRGTFSPSLLFPVLFRSHRLKARFSITISMFCSLQCLKTLRGFVFSFSVSGSALYLYSVSRVSGAEVLRVCCIAVPGMLYQQHRGEVVMNVLSCSTRWRFSLMLISVPALARTLLFLAAVTVRFYEKYPGSAAGTRLLSNGIIYSTLPLWSLTTTSPSTFLPAFSSRVTDLCCYFGLCAKRRSLLVLPTSLFSGLHLVILPGCRPWYGTASWWWSEWAGQLGRKAGRGGIYKG